MLVCSGTTRCEGDQVQNSPPKRNLQPHLCMNNNTAACCKTLLSQLHVVPPLWCCIASINTMFAGPFTRRVGDLNKGLQ